MAGEDENFNGRTKLAENTPQGMKNKYKKWVKEEIISMSQEEYIRLSKIEDADK